MRSVLRCLYALVLAACVGGAFWWAGVDTPSTAAPMVESDRPISRPPPAVPGADAAGSALPGQTDALREWLRQRPHAGQPEEIRTWENNGLALAQERRAALLELMRKDPRRALEHSLRWDEWEALPAALRAVSETPISEWVRQDAYVGCDPGEGRVTRELRITRPDGVEIRAYSHGRRQNPLTRAGLPVQGFVMGTEAALEASAVQAVAGPEAAAVERLLPPLKSGLQDSAWSGRSLAGADAVTVVIGGRVGKVLAEELPALTQKIQSIEAVPGESAGVAELAAWLDGGEGGVFVPLASEELVALEANPWTTTPKKVLVMRIDFSDLPGARETHADLTAKLENEVSPALEEMSFGKTRLILTVTPEVIRVPQLSTYYKAEQDAGRNGNGQLHDDARAGAEALGYVIADYDFWCVHFKGIGLGYGGLAIVGGGKSWIQGSSANVFGHEFGHNYGLGHADVWQPDSNGDPLSNDGTAIEYGSKSSIMGSGPFPTAHFDSQAKVVLEWLD